MKEEYKFYEDGNHAWLEVDREELGMLGIANKISSYSYEYDEKVYLEEDCDASLFIKAKRQFFGEKVKLKRIYKKDIFIRKLRFYECIT